MPQLDISKAAISGVSLTALEYVLEVPKARSVTKAAMNGGLLTLSDLLVQSLAGGNMDELRTFLYKEHEPLTIAMIYTLIQELKDIFIDSGYEQYQALIPKIIANLFLSAGAISVGSSVNRMLGLDEAFISAMKAEKKMLQTCEINRLKAHDYDIDHKNDKKSKDKGKKREVWNE